jgi:uncharacterized protein DUF6600/FecR-like protein
MTRLSLAAVLVLGVAGAAHADDDYRHGRVRYVEDGTSLQRAAEPGAEEAEANLPFLPGDRVWTDDRGRVEFQFEGGAFLRLDSETKLDYLDNAGDRVVLRLWSGGLYLQAASGGTDFEIETPGGVITTRGRGVYRVDARSGETRLSVYDGEADLAGGRGARVRDGERLYARDGEVVRGPSAFDRQEADDFAMWNDQRQESVRYARVDRPSDLPSEAAPYYDELYEYGSWSREPMVGYVWRPRVAIGWQPYAQGRWSWTPFGWTWIAYEPWGWAPFHYGRWGYSAIGWYWIPDRNWGPAWVSWAVGGPYVGWSPLGFRNQPIIVYERNHRGGHAVPRAGSGAWVYARNGDMTARDLPRRRVQQIDPGELAQVRVVASPRARLTKDLHVVEGPLAASGAVRSVRTKPTPGDTVPELREGNQALIPPAAVRRRRDAEGRYDRGSSFGEAAGHADTARARKPEAAPAHASDPAIAPEARPQASPAGRSRYRDAETEARPRGGSAGSDDGAARREYAPPPRREREGGQRDGGASASTPRGESGGEARPRGGEAAPRHEGGSAPAAKAPPATKERSSSSGGARRKG